jgi:hypothetical protein
MLRKILLVLFGLLFIIQFIKPAKNSAQGEQTNNISKKYAMSTDVNSILKKACFDCHSNTTVYPWYSEIQPVAWFLDDHVKEGKEHLNFDEFLSYEAKKQDHKLEEFIESQTEGWMPIDSYKWIHKNAVLTSEEKQVLINWAKQVRSEIGYSSIESSTD